MKIKMLGPILLFAMTLYACSAAISLQGKSAGILDGKFFYQNGNMTKQYPADIETVWKACEKSMADLHAVSLEKERAISTGVLRAWIQEEKILLKLEYLDKNVTSVSVLVGPFGNAVASHLIHETIRSNLSP